MAYLSLNEKSQTIRYALLSTNVAKVLIELDENMELTEDGRAILARGEDLIREIVEGAKLVEGKDFKNNASPTEQSLTAYGYALNTLEMLNIIKTEEGFTEYFESLCSRIRNLITGHGKDKDIGSMKRFFLVLGSAFREDLEKDRYAEPRTKWIGLGRASAYATSLP